MKKIGVKEVRMNLADILREDHLLYEMAISTPDDDLLKMNLYDDFVLDSLDVEDIFVTLCNSRGITVKVNPLTKFSFHQEQTVENFIEMVNYCLSHGVTNDR